VNFQGKIGFRIFMAFKIPYHLIRLTVFLFGTTWQAKRKDAVKKGPRRTAERTREGEPAEGAQRARKKGEKIQKKN